MILHQQMNEDTPMYRLVVLKGAEPDFRTVIREASVLVGSDEKCRVCLPDASLAPQHLALRMRDGEVVVQVLGGAGEVLHNGEGLSEAVLGHGDVLEIGDLHLQFQVVRPLPFHATRSAGLVYTIAGAGLVAIFGLELLVVGGLWFVGPGEAPQAALAGDEVHPDLYELTNQLVSARTHLESLQAQQGVLSPEDLWASGGSVDLAQEIERVRTRVSHLDATLQQLAVPGQGTQISTPENLEAKARTMLTDARRAIAAGEFDVAEERLRQLLELTPGNIKAYMTRARLRERTGDKQAAIDQWDEVVKRSVDTTLKEEATAERVRLLREIRQEESKALEDQKQMLADQERERLELEAQREADRLRFAAEERQDAERMAADRQTSETAAREKAAREKAALEKAARDKAALEKAARDKAALEKAARDKAARDKAAREQAVRDQAAQEEAARLAAERARMRQDVAEVPRIVQVHSVHGQKLPSRENYDEIRLVRIELKRRKSGGPILRHRLRIDVDFFDKEPATGRVLSSRVPAPQKGLNLTADWTLEDTKSFSALYMVPSGYREAERERTGRLMQFHGYVVRVYYNAQLQGEHAFPAALLDR